MSDLFTSQNSSIRVSSGKDGPDLFVDGLVMRTSTNTPFNACVRVNMFEVTMPKTTRSEKNEMFSIFECFEFTDC